MKIFSLRRLGLLSSAIALTATMCACAPETNNTPVFPVKESGQVVIVPTPTPTVSPEVVNKNNRPEFVYDSEAPTVVPIEKVVMEDGTIGYKMPRFYFPYQVDDTKPMPALSPVLEETDEYRIMGGNVYIGPDGTEMLEGYDGAVAVYWPNLEPLMLLSEDREAYLEKAQAIREEYGEDSIEFQLYLRAQEVEGLAIDIYWTNQESYGPAWK